MDSSFVTLLYLYNLIMTFGSGYKVFVVSIYFDAPNKKGSMFYRF